MKLNSTILILLFLLTPVSALADFSGMYAPGNWTTTLGGTPPGAGGSIDTSGAPTSITLNGGNSGCTSGPCLMDYTITAPASGPVSFDWDYATADPDGPSFDLFLLLNGSVVTQLSNSAGPNVQSGTENFTVVAGDTFGFRIDPTDGILGAATVTISNFSGPVPPVVPTLSEWGMIILSLLMAVAAFLFLRCRTIVTKGTLS